MASKNKELFTSWKRYCRSEDGRKVSVDSLLSEKKYIYHYLEWPFAKSIFQRNELRFSQIGSWNDPYEKAWCRLLFEGRNNLNGLSAYGLCWTTSKFNEPFWRMVGFKKEHAIVRIRSRVSDILNVGSALIENEVGSFYLGKVDYMREQDMHTLADRTLRNELKDVSSTASGLLLKKRNAFCFEKEVRLIWLDRADKRDALFIPVDAAKIIDQVLISPHATSQESDTIRSEFELFGVNTLKSGVLCAPKNPSLRHI